MSEVFVAIESCGCVAGATTLRRPVPVVQDFLNEMAGIGVPVKAMPVEEFRSRPPTCKDHPDGPPHWPSNQEVPA